MDIGPTDILSCCGDRILLKFVQRSACHQTSTFNAPSLHLRHELVMLTAKDTVAIKKVLCWKLTAENVKCRTVARAEGSGCRFVQTEASMGQFRSATVEQCHVVFRHRHDSSSSSLCILHLSSLTRLSNSIHAFPEA